MRPWRLGISSSRSWSSEEPRITSSSSLSCQISHSLRQSASASGESGSRSMSLPLLLMLAQLKDDVGYLWGEQLFHAEPDGVARTRQARDELGADGPGHGAAQHGGGPDLLVREHPEELAEPVELFLDHAGNPPVGATGGRPRPAAPPSPS